MSLGQLNPKERKYYNKVDILNVKDSKGRDKHIKQFKKHKFCQKWLQLSPSNQNRTKNMNTKLFAVIMPLYLPKTSVKYIENMFPFVFLEKFHSGYYVTENKGKKDTTSDVVSYPWFFFLILFFTTKKWNPSIIRSSYASEGKQIPCGNNALTWFFKKYSLPIQFFNTQVVQTEWVPGDH